MPCRAKLSSQVCCLPDVLGWTQGAVHLLFSTVLDRSPLSMALTLSALEAFYWIVELGSFHAAAGKLNLSQPAISARIRELEASLGRPLFDRVGRSVRATPTGRKAFEHAARILADVHLLQLDAGANPAVSGIVRIGSGELVARLWLPEMLAELQSSYPALQLDVEVDVTVNLRQKLQQGEIDIGFLAGPIQDPELEVHPLMKLDMCWMGAPPLLRQGERVSADQLASMPVVTLTKVSYLHALTQSWFAAQKLQARTVHVCNSVALLLSLVRLGVGASILPRMLITPDSGLHEMSRRGLPKMTLFSVLHARDRGRPAELVNQLALSYARTGLSRSV